MTRFLYSSPLRIRGAYSGLLAQGVDSCGTELLVPGNPVGRSRGHSREEVTSTSMNVEGKAPQDAQPQGKKAHLTWPVGGWRRGQVGHSVLAEPASRNPDQRGNRQVGLKQHFRAPFRLAGSLPRVVQVFLHPDPLFSLHLREWDSEDRRSPPKGGRECDVGCNIRKL